MADNPDTNANGDLADETDGLRRELANLRAVLAERRDDMVAAASRATQAVVTPIRENPALLVLFSSWAGLLGCLSAWPSANQISGPGTGTTGIGKFEDDRGW
jgi:hypothetical protein